LLTTAYGIHERTQEYAIIVGACIDPSSGKASYGGFSKDIQKGVLPVSAIPQQCYGMNGNTVLIPHLIAAKVGNVSADYTQNMGDIDYAVRACKAGFKIIIAPGATGFCDYNSYTMWGWADSKIPFRQRWKLLHGPKGVPPIEYMKYRRQCGFSFWYLVPIKLYLQVFFPGIRKM
jgi:GT2 family glycosyltransferase